MPGTTVLSQAGGDKYLAVAPGANGTGLSIEEGSVAILTVLFTDIEGSTALTERLGDELWVEVLSAHDAVVRDALRVHGGREVKTIGDGFMAVFGRAHQAVAAARQIQAGMAAVAVPGVPGGLRIRVGVHTGPVVCRDGDVLGRNVNVARRIASAASGGQILVSAAVKVLAGQEGDPQDSSPTTLRLRGIAEPQMVFDVPVAGAAGKVARLRLVASR